MTSRGGTLWPYMSLENYTACREYVQCFLVNFRNPLRVYGSLFGCRQLKYSIYCTVILSRKDHNQDQIVTRLIHATYSQLPFFPGAPQVSLKPGYPTKVHLVHWQQLVSVQCPPPVLLNLSSSTSETCVSQVMKEQPLLWERMVW